MPGELLLVNPRRRRRRRRKMSALQRQYFGKRRVTRARRNPLRRRRAPFVQVVNRNPRRRRRHTRRHVMHMRRNPIRRRHRGTRYRRNPLGINLGGFFNDTLVPSAIGAGGALGVDMVLGYFAPYLPSMLTQGWGNVITRIAAAIGLGYVGQSVGGRRFGENVMAGAVIVTLYDVAKTYLQPYGLPGLGYIAPAPQLGIYVDGDGTNYAQFGGSRVADFNSYLFGSPTLAAPVSVPVTDTASGDTSGMGIYV